MSSHGLNFVYSRSIAALKEKAPPKRGREQHMGNGGRLAFSLHKEIRPFFSFCKSIGNASPLVGGRDGPT
jgi:hypothetical protein